MLDVRVAASTLPAFMLLAPSAGPLCGAREAFVGSAAQLLFGSDLGTDVSCGDPHVNQHGGLFVHLPVNALGGFPPGRLRRALRLTARDRSSRASAAGSFLVFFIVFGAMWCSFSCTAMLCPAVGPLELLEFESFDRRVRSGTSPGCNSVAHSFLGVSLQVLLCQQLPIMLFLRQRAYSSVRHWVF